LSVKRFLRSSHSVIREASPTPQLRNRRGRFVSLLALLLLVIFHMAGFAQQGSNAGLTGMVTDRSGSGVGNAHVVAANHETGVIYTAKATEAGVYTIPSLPPGVYDVSATHEGYNKAVVKDITSYVGQLITVNLNLDIASTSDTVTVSSDAQLLETGSPQIDYIIGKKEMEDWPLIATSDGERDVSQFLYNNLPGATGVSFTGSINGGQTRSNEIYLEGVPLGTMDTAEEGISVDAVRELNLQVGVMNAQYNGGGTAVTNLAVKSGTNQIHGSLIAILQNEDMNANSYAAKQAGRERAQDRFTTYGGTVGGPVYTPKIYGGRNKSFFFFDFERDQIKNLGYGGANATLPTQAMLGGDFSAWLSPALTLDSRSGTTVTQDILGRPVVFGQIYDPATTRILKTGQIDTVTGLKSTGNGFVRDPFPGNKISPSRFDPVAANLLKLNWPKNYLSSQVVGNIPTLAKTLPLLVQKFYTIKFDQVLTANQRLSILFDDNQRSNINGGTYWSLPSDKNILDVAYNQAFHTQITRVNHYWTLSPTISNHVGAGYFRIPISFNSVDQRNWASQLGIPNFSGMGFPTFDFTGSTSLGGGTKTLGVAGSYQGQLRSNSDFMVIDQVYVSRGAHQMQGGFEGRFYLSNWTNGNAPGTYQFSSAMTDDGTSTASYAGNSFASLLLGQVNSLSSTVYAGTQHYRRRQAGVYFQDDWKAARNFTLNLGLRWEFIGKLYETNGQWSGVDLTIPNPAAAGLPGALVFASQLGKKSFENPDWRVFLPRVGFAYNPDPRIVFRGGFGINSQAPVYSAEPFQGQTLPPTTGYSASIAVDATHNPQPYAGMAVAKLSDPYPAPTTSLPNYNPAQLNLQSVTVNNPAGSKPLTYASYTMGIQVDMGRGVIAQINYVGNVARRIRQAALTQMNQLPLSALQTYGDALLDNIKIHPEIPKPYPTFAGTVRQALAPYPQFAGGGVSLFDPGAGWSRYDAMQVTLTKRVNSGLSIFATYSWSKTLTNTNGGLQDVSNKQAAKAEASFIHVPQMFKLTAIYDLPIGKGKLLNVHGPLDWIAGGWKLSGNGIYQSGDTLTITDSFVSNGIFATTRPNFTGQAVRLNQKGFIDTVHNRGPVYLNPAAFTHVPYTSNNKVALTTGNVPSVLPGIQGPGYAYENMGLQKAFSFGETRSFSLRVVAANALNRAGLGDPVTDINNANFGRILSTQAATRQNFTPRTVQVEAHLTF